MKCFGCHGSGYCESPLYGKLKCVFCDGKGEILMHHDSFTYLKNKKDGTVFMYYGTYMEFLDMHPKDKGKYEETTFEALDLDTLVELLENIMEDRNWHTRAEYEPRLIANSMLSAGIDKQACENAMRNLIIGIEERK